MAVGKEMMAIVMSAQALVRAVTVIMTVPAAIVVILYVMVVVILVIGTYHRIAFFHCSDGSPHECVGGQPIYWLFSLQGWF
jgi:hypothetical protein